MSFLELLAQAEDGEAGIYIKYRLFILESLLQGEGVSRSLLGYGEEKVSEVVFKLSQEYFLSLSLFAPETAPKAHIIICACVIDYLIASLNVLFGFDYFEHLKKDEKALELLRKYEELLKEREGLLSFLMSYTALFLTSCERISGYDPSNPKNENALNFFIELAGEFYANSELSSLISLLGEALEPRAREVRDYDELFSVEIS